MTEHSPGDRHQELADLGQLHGPAAAMKQLDLEVILQRPYVRRDRRLTDIEQLRGGREPALAGDRMEGRK